MIKVVNRYTGDISKLVENLEDEPLDIDIDIVTGKLYWITSSGKLQSHTTAQIETISEFGDNIVPSSFTIFEVSAYIAFQRSRNVIRIDLLKPESR